MRYLRQGTDVRITVGPFFDVTDGITPKAALTVTNTTCEMFYDDDDNTATHRVALTLTASGGSNDMVHVTDDTCGMYDLELTSSNTTVCGRLMLVFYDTDVHLPVFHEFTVLPQQIYDSLVAGTDLLDISIVQVGGDATSLTDLKDFVDNCFDPAENTVAVPSTELTPPANFDLMVIDANGRIDVGAVLGETPMTAADVNAEVDTALTNAALATASSITSLDGKIDIIDTNVDTIITNIASIMGTSFTEATDSLNAIATLVAAFDTTDIVEALDDIKGTAFVKDTNSLVNLTSTGGPGSVIAD